MERRGYAEAEPIDDYEEGTETIDICEIFKKAIVEGHSKKNK